MTTKKSIRFAAPYRSSTFNEAHDTFVGANGVLSGGLVTTSGTIVTVQPLSFVQNGQFVTTDYTMSATLPLNITAPYSIAVSSPNTTETLSEVLTPTFVKRPQDVGANTVVVADWDGDEWIQRPKLQVAELIKAAQDRAVAQDVVGICRGFDVLSDTTADTVSVGPGSLIDRQGSLITKERSTTFSVPALSSSDFQAGYDRIDTITYRRPSDDHNRPGQLRYLTGPLVYKNDSSDFGRNPLVTYVGESGTYNFVWKVARTASGIRTLYTKDYGERAELFLVTQADSEGSASTQIASAGVSGADFAADFTTGHLEVVYSKGSSLYHKRVDADGAEINSEFLVAAESTAILNPKVLVIGHADERFVHIIYETANSAADHRIKYVRVSVANTIETPPTTLVSLNAYVTGASVAKDDDDLTLYLAYENRTTGRAYLRTYDVASSTATDAPVQQGTTLELQDSTYDLVADQELPVTGASSPTVVRTDNKDLYVFWKHETLGGNKVLAVYNQDFYGRLAYKAVGVSLTAGLVPDEDVVGYSVVVDAMSQAIVIYKLSNNNDQAVWKSKIDLESETLSVKSGLFDFANALESSSSALEIDGSLHGAVSDNTGAGGVIEYANNSNASLIQFVGPGSFSGNAVANNEIVLLETTGNPLSPGYTDLTYAPTAGDKIIISGSGASATANDGTYSWSSSRIITIESTNYVVVATDGVFTADTQGASAQFRYRTGGRLLYGRLTTDTSERHNMRGFKVSKDDVYIASIRASDQVAAASGLSIDESDPVSRIYEFINCFFGGGGTASFTAVSGGTLSFTQNLSVKFFNRKATYTIPASTGTAIGQNQVAFVHIPDEDVSQDLALVVDDFGDGILDRYGKNAFPLFWNIDGVLYSRFSPFRISAGESVQIGDQISQQLINWLECGSSVPDASNHGYTSLTGFSLTQADGPITAMSKADSVMRKLLDWAGIPDTEPNALDHGYTSTSGFALNQDDSPIAAIGKADSVVRAFLDWAGIPDTSPDASNHTYSSVDGAALLQSDSILSAIGKIDTRLRLLQDWAGTGTTPSTSDHGYTNTYKISATDSTVEALSDLDAAIESTDSELNKYTGQCRLTALGTKRVSITAADLTVLDGSKITKTISSLKLAFTGAQIDFSTGTIYAADGVTALGQDFTPTALTAGDYHWYSVSLVPTTETATNELSAQVLVIPASTSSATLDNAPKAAYPSGAVNLGMVRVRGTALDVIENISQSDIELLVIGSGSGSGSSGEAGAGVEPASGFKAITFDTFDVSASSSDSTVDATTGRTNATYSVTKQLYALTCDKEKTISSSAGTSLSVDAPVSWLKAGDIVYVTSGARTDQWRRIVSVSGSDLILDAAFAGGDASAGDAVMLSQAVWTKDLVNLGSAAEKTRLRDLFPSVSIPAVSLYYEDSVNFGDDVPNAVDAAAIVAAACPEGLQSDSTTPDSTLYSSIFRRPQAPSQIPDYVQDSSATDKQRLFLVFFADPTNASVTTNANLLYYEASLYPEETLYVGGILSSAYGMTNGGSGASQNNLTVTTALDGATTVTEITLGFNYVPGLNSGRPDGDLEVIIDGLAIPRFYTGVQGTYYREVSGSTTKIWLSDNFTALPYSIQIRRRQGSIDSADTNRAKISLMADAIVGTADQVTLGIATHSSIQAAHDAVTAGGKVFVLSGTYLGNVVWSKSDVCLEGKGRQTVLSGNFTLAGSGNQILGIKVAGDLDLTGSNYNFVRAWISDSSSFTAGGSENLLNIIQE